MAGWLQVVPEGANLRRSETRAETLPVLDPAETAAEHWRAAGICGQGFSGPVPLTWQDLLAYATLSGLKKPAIFWEVLRDMSLAYVSALNDTSPLSTAPINRGKND